jgi:hypothetical protein
MPFLKTSNKTPEQYLDVGHGLFLPNHTLAAGTNYKLKLATGSRVLEKLISVQLLNKFSAFHDPRRFISVFTRARHV